MIEFADPGIDWTPLYWSLAGLAAGIVMAGIGFAVMKKPSDNTPVPGILVTFVCLVLTITSLIIQPTNSYRYAVNDAKIAALEEHGFDYVTLSGNEFTAEHDGGFYRGVLIDLKPPTDYAYQIVEIPND